MNPSFRGKLDSPSEKARYTYPGWGRIKIEPPFWCSIFLCQKMGSSFRAIKWRNRKFRAVDQDLVP
jgi:hypothetical protein